MRQTVAAIVFIIAMLNPVSSYAKVHYCCSPNSNPATRHHAIVAFNERSLPAKVRHSGFVARVTSYTGADPVQRTGVHTALGTVAGYGQVAVDPYTIPLGTWLYIPGYGLARATDTGGAVHGTHIDACFGLGGYGSVAWSRAKTWGTRLLKVYVVPEEMLALIRS